MGALNRVGRGQRATLREQLQGKVMGDEGVKLIEQNGYGMCDSQNRHN